jgi:cytochrome P450
MEHARPESDPIDLSSMAFWSKAPAERELDFRILRDERPVSWHPPAEGSLMPHEGDGFWGVTRHEDVVTVSRTPKDFCSGKGVMLEEVPEDLLDAAQSFLAMDAPEHSALRQLISSAFTPRQVRRIDEHVRGQAERIVDELLDVPEGDFVEQVARKLPMWTIYEMMGLPDAEREAASHGADGMVSWNDDDVRQGREPIELLFESLMALVRIGHELAEDRRKHPGDDLMSALVAADVDGRKLTDDEIGAFFVLLSVAGNDTTRNTITGGMRALTEFPDQRALLRAGYEAVSSTMAEEMIRWVSPVMTFRRTATRDLELGGHQIRGGDWLVMFYASANRDERAFEADPHVFDVRRTPNNHVGFGGGGPHFCLGNQLARTQLRAIFDQLTRRAPDLQVGEPVRLVGNFIDGVKSIPYQLSPG